MVDHDEDEDDELPEQEEQSLDDAENVALVKLYPEDIDAIFDTVLNSIELLHTVMANLYQLHKQKVVDYDVLKTELDTKDDELKKYKDKLLEIYSQQAPKPTKRKGKKNE